MKKILAVALFFLLLPATTLAAGFASQSLFLSKNSVTEGEVVRVYAVVQNDTTTAFSGMLTLEDEKGSIGTVPVSLTEGEANTLSISWKPAAGRHTITAKLQTGGTTVGTETAVFTISPKPQAAANLPESTPADSSEPVQSAIATLSPAAAQTLEPVFSVIDSARTKVISALDGSIAYTKSQVVPGEVLGVETIKNTPATASGIGGTLWKICMTLALYTLSILRYLVANAGIFYPVLALLFLFSLWRLFQRYRRPSY